MAEQNPEEKPNLDPATGVADGGASSGSAPDKGVKTDKSTKHESAQKLDTDPVTSRAPEQLDKIKKSDGKGGLATRDP